MDDNMEYVSSGGTADPPGQPASPGGAPPSAVDAEALAKALEPTLKRLVEQQWQSGKDSRIAKLTGKVDGFEAQLARLQELMGKGLSQEDALWRMKVEDSLATQPEIPQAAAPKAGTATPPPAPGFDLDAFLKAAGIDPNDAEVTAMVRDGRTGLPDIASLVVKRASQPKPTPNAAQAMPTGSGGTAAGETVEDIDRQLAELRKKPAYQISRVAYDALLAKRRSLTQK